MSKDILEFQQALTDMDFYNYVKEHSGLGEQMPTPEEMNNIVLAVAIKESGGNSKERPSDPRFTASGICQFTDGTYKSCLQKLTPEMEQKAVARINEVTGGNYSSLSSVPESVFEQDNIKNDNALQGFALSQLWAENFARMKNKGIEINATSTAIMHQYGGDGLTILSGDPATSVLELDVYKSRTGEDLTKTLEGNGLNADSTFGDIIEKTQKTTGEANERLAEEKRKAGKELLKDRELVLAHMNEKGGEEGKKQAQLAKQAFENGDLDGGLKITGDYLDKALGLDDKRKDLEPSQKNMARILGIVLGIDEANAALDNPEKKLSEIAPQDRVNKLHGKFKEIPNFPAAGDLTAGTFLDNAEQIESHTRARAADKAKDGDWLSLIKEFGPMLGSVLGSGPEGLLMIAIVACVAMAMFAKDDKEKDGQPQPTHAAGQQQVAQQQQFALLMKEQFFAEGKGGAQTNQTQTIESGMDALVLISSKVGPEKMKEVIADLHKGSTAVLEATLNDPAHNFADNEKANAGAFFKSLNPAQKETLADSYQLLQDVFDKKVVSYVANGRQGTVDVSAALAESRTDALSDTTKAEIQELRGLFATISGAAVQGPDAFQVMPATTPAPNQAPATVTSPQRGG